MGFIAILIFAIPAIGCLIEDLGSIECLAN